MLYRVVDGNKMVAGVPVFDEFISNAGFFFLSDSGRSVYVSIFIATQYPNYNWKYRHECVCAERR